MLTLPQVLWPLLSIVRTNLRGQSSLWPPIFPINRLLPCSWWPNYIDLQVGSLWFLPSLAIPSYLSSTQRRSVSLQFISGPRVPSQGSRTASCLLLLNFLTPCLLTHMPDYCQLFYSPAWECHYLWILLKVIVSNPLLTMLSPGSICLTYQTLLQRQWEMPWTNKALFLI